MLDRRTHTHEGSAFRQDTARGGDGQEAQPRAGAGVGVQGVGAQGEAEEARLTRGGGALRRDRRRVEGLPGLLAEHAQDFDRAQRLLRRQDGARGRQGQRTRGGDVDHRLRGLGRTREGAYYINSATATAESARARDRAHSQGDIAFTTGTTESAPDAARTRARTSPSTPRSCIRGEAKLPQRREASAELPGGPSTSTAACRAGRRREGDRHRGRLHR